MTEDSAVETEVVLKLKTPLKIQGTEIVELILREPTAGELSAAEQAGAKKGGNEQMISLIGFACGKHPNVIRQLKGSDFNRAAAVIADFFGDGQETGVNSSQT